MFTSYYIRELYYLSCIYTVFYYNQRQHKYSIYSVTFYVTSGRNRDLWQLTIKFIWSDNHVAVMILGPGEDLWLYAVCPCCFLLELTAHSHGLLGSNWFELVRPRPQCQREPCRSGLLWVGAPKTIELDRSKAVPRAVWTRSNRERPKWKQFWVWIRMCRIKLPHVQRKRMASSCLWGLLL